MGLVDIVFGWFAARPRLQIVLEDGTFGIGGRVPGHVEATGGRRAMTLEHLTICLVRVRTDERDGAPVPEIQTAVVVERTIAANVTVSARETKSFPFAITIPDNAKPSAAKLAYRVEVVGMAAGRSGRSSVDVKILDTAQARLGGEGVFDRWPGLREGEGSAALDALREIRWEHDSDGSKTNLVALEPAVADLVAADSSAVRHAALTTWATLIAGRETRGHADVLRGVLESDERDEQLAKEAIDIAGKLPTEEGLELLLSQAKDGSSEVRRAVVLATRHCAPGEPGVLPILDALADDEEPLVREAVYRGYGAYESDLDVMRRVARGVSDEGDIAVLEATIATLRGAYFNGGADVVRPAFERLSIHPSPQVRKAVAAAIYFAEVDADSIPIVERLLDDEQGAVRAVAAAELKHLTTVGPRFVAKLKRMAKDDPDPAVRKGAVTSLPEFVEVEDMTRIVEQIVASDDDPQVQVGVIEGIAYREEPGYRELLDALAQSPIEVVASAAAAKVRPAGPRS